MEEPDSPTPDTRSRTWGPIVVVAALAAVAFAAALLLFRGGGSSSDQDLGAQGSGCPEGRPDASYTVVMESDPSPPRVEGTTFHLTVRHDGKAVTGAKVCISADMSEMHHEGINTRATEAAGGRYDTKLKFGMRGPYGASVVVTEPGHAPVSVPLSFDVD